MGSNTLIPTSKGDLRGTKHNTIPFLGLNEANYTQTLIGLMGVGVWAWVLGVVGVVGGVGGVSTHHGLVN